MSDENPVVRWTVDDIKRIVFWSACVEGHITAPEFVALCRLECAPLESDTDGDRWLAARELTADRTIRF
jgi:hypothetical protein